MSVQRWASIGLGVLGQILFREVRKNVCAVVSNPDENVDLSDGSADFLFTCVAEVFVCLSCMCRKHQKGC
jgi:hypothetical protein